jgi:16S rRNA C967 or C1407 C5-methylase (RsmB/RsmF family)/NOL1/NOP2/fmu family ribosome biogenesis protein
MTLLSDKFRSMIQDLWGVNEALALEAALSDESPVSIRLNPLKPSHHFENLEPVPWCPNGYYLPSRISFTLDPYFHGGHYYVQEASSMWLDHVIRSLGLPKESKILDLCAAPGGKTTLIAGTLGKEVMIHAHETHSSRAEVLRQNLVKWGYPNFLVSTGPIQKLPASGILYDLVVVDAPCSGEGMFRKEPEAIAQWNDLKVNKCHFMQRDILQIATQLVRPGGYILYSTCTFNSKENEESLSTILSGGNFQSLHVPHHPKIESLIKSDNGSSIVYRCLPHRIRGEGFSFSLLKNANNEEQNVTLRKNNENKATAKPDSLSVLNRYIQNPSAYRIAEYESGFCALRESWVEAYQSCRNAKIQLIHAGIPLGSFKGKDWVPNHALALSTELDPNNGKVSMDLAQSLDYLRALDPKEIPPPDQDQNKWFLASFESVNLGWFKLNGHKFKNYLPKDLRIRNL